MVLQTGMHPATIKDSVTSCVVFLPKHLILMVPACVAPGGCTIAGLLSLEDNRVRSTIARAIQVAAVKAHELGQPESK
jgi:pyrroline-5-carboxylate reductase